MLPSLDRPHAKRTSVSTMVPLPNCTSYVAWVVLIMNHVRIRNYHSSLLFQKSFRLSWQVRNFIPDDSNYFFARVRT